MARAAAVKNADGQIDVLKTIGGYQGLAESIVPALVFSVVFTVGRDLPWSLAAAIVSAMAFTIVRLVQKSSITQALVGIAGVAICAVVAMRSGDPNDYFLPGFFVNGGYILAMILSIAIKWPVAGLLFGFIRGEGTQWRTNVRRRRAYATATWIVIGVLALRLSVQLPLYAAGQFVELATARIVMGLPLYALGLWFAWLVSRSPEDVPQDQQTEDEDLS
nr:DUF3159 domain-containing protein [Arthrobacter roseus]